VGARDELDSGVGEEGVWGIAVGSGVRKAVGSIEGFRVGSGEGNGDGNGEGFMDGADDVTTGGTMKVAME
jgi:hypothetical protein